MRRKKLLHRMKKVCGATISSFTSESPLRIVCATVAFGMGLDCTDVCQVMLFCFIIGCHNCSYSAILIVFCAFKFSSITLSLSLSPSCALDIVLCASVGGVLRGLATPTAKGVFSYTDPFLD